MHDVDLPKSISNTDTVNILAKMDKLRKNHAMNVANRFNLSLTEVKIMGFIRCNELKRGLSDILDCHNMGKLRCHARLRDWKRDHIFIGVVNNLIKNA